MMMMIEIAVVGKPRNNSCYLLEIEKNDRLRIYSTYQEAIFFGAETCLSNSSSR